MGRCFWDGSVFWDGRVFLGYEAIPTSFSSSFTPLKPAPPEGDAPWDSDVPVSLTAAPCSSLQLEFRDVIP